MPALSRGRRGGHRWGGAGLLRWSFVASPHGRQRLEPDLAVTRITEAFLKLDESRGAIGRTAIAEFLATDVADLLKGRFASDVARAAAFGAAAEVAYLAGFKAHDGGLDGLAQRYYLAAYRLAGETGEPGHQAFVLRILALQGTDIGERRFTVRLAERALAVGRGRCDPDTTALLQVAAARCHAESGDGGPALEMLRAAEPVLTADYSPDVPRWAAMWCSTRATLINQTAKAFLAVNEVAEAERHFALAASACRNLSCTWGGATTIPCSKTSRMAGPDKGKRQVEGLRACTRGTT